MTVTPVSGRGLDDQTFVVTTQANSLLPVPFVAPLLNPSPGGLVNAVAWTEQVDPPRWLAEGVLFRSSLTGNFSGELATGVWDRDWCAEPGSGSGDGSIKFGVRAEDSDPFYAATVWSYDSCDLTPASQAEVRTRAAQTLRMREGPLVAREFGYRLASDASAPVTAADIVDAVGELEALFADANVLGVVHASARLAAEAVAAHMALPAGAGWYATPLGHRWVFDSGYRVPLGDNLLVATSALFGWRTQPELREVIHFEENEFVAIAERSSVIGFEQFIGAASLEGGSS